MRTPQLTILPLLYMISLLLLVAPGIGASVVDLRGEEAEQTLAELRRSIESESNNFETLRDAGIILHQISRGEVTQEWVEEGEDYLKRARKLRPDDLETQAWLGSITTMKAQFVSDPGKQTFFVKLGTRLMDGAIRKAPDDPLLRLIRGYNSMELPAFLKRTRFAVDDFGHYLALCETAECPPHQVELARSSLEQARKIVVEQQ